MWLGPAPKRPFNRSRFHGNWRWFFDYGTGDLGNDGVHRLDIARWALEAGVLAQGGKPLGFPRSVSAVGGKYYFDDAQEWPDTLQVTYDFPGYVLTYEMRIWTPYPLDGESEGPLVYGDGGYLVIGNSRWRAYDAKGKLMKEDSGSDQTLGPRPELPRLHAQPPEAHRRPGDHRPSLQPALPPRQRRLASRPHAEVRSRRRTPSPATPTPTSTSRVAEYRKPWLLPKIADL